MDCGEELESSVSLSTVLKSVSYISDFANLMDSLGCMTIPPSCSPAVAASNCIGIQASQDFDSFHCLSQDFSPSDLALIKFAQEYRWTHRETNKVVELAHHPMFNPTDLSKNLQKKLDASIEKHGLLFEVDFRPSDPELVFSMRWFLTMLFQKRMPGSITFEYWAEKIGQGKVPLSIVLYIDGTLVRTNIKARPIYRKLFHQYLKILSV